MSVLSVTERMILGFGLGMVFPLRAGLMGNGPILGPGSLAAL
jgi:hypothetical protein